MATQDQDSHTCQQCGATLAADLRYCLQCYSPVGASSARVHVESAREITTTHRSDPTIVFSPERHEAIVRRARGRKRVTIGVAIVVVVIVAGVIAWSAIRRHQREIEKVIKREQAAQRDLGTLAEALERFRLDAARYPTNQEGLTGLTRRPAAFPPDAAEHEASWLGPYVDHVPEVDPWGNDYVYKTTDAGGSFELLSYGPGGGETGSDSRFRVVSRTRADAAPR